MFAKIRLLLIPLLLVGLVYLITREFAVTLAAAAVVFALLAVTYLLEQHTKTKGALFTGQPTPLMRLFGLVLGLLFAALPVVEWGSAGTIHPLWLILAITLIGYGLGAGRWLRILQGAEAIKVGTTEIQLGVEGARGFGPKRITGIEGMSINEINLELQRGGRFVVFERCISAIFITYRTSSDIYYIKAGESTFSKSIGHSLISLLFGWWAISGPWQTLAVLATNLRSGKEVTKEVIVALNQPRAA